MTVETGSYDVLGPWLELLKSRDTALQDVRFCLRMAAEATEQGEAVAWTKQAEARLNEMIDIEDELEEKYPN